MSMTMTVSGADRSLKFDWKAASSAWAADVEPLASRAMKMQSPVGAGPTAGNLRQSIGSRLEPSAGQMWVVLYGTVPYLPYVVGGTGPHVIAARNAKALRWFANRGHGPIMFAKSVNHPGTKPNNFPERAISPLTSLILQSFADAVREATIVE
jgi:hypothetical protein